MYNVDISFVGGECLDHSPLTTLSIEALPTFLIYVNVLEFPWTKESHQWMLIIGEIQTVLLFHWKPWQSNATSKWENKTRAVFFVKNIHSSLQVFFFFLHSIIRLLMDQSSGLMDSALEFEVKLHTSPGPKCGTFNSLWLKLIGSEQETLPVNVNEHLVPGSVSILFGNET